MHKKSFIRKNWLLIVAIAYILSPIDFIPDFLLPAGFADDIAVVLFALFKRYMEHKKEVNSKIEEGEIINE